MDWRTEQLFDRRAPRKLVFPPSSLENEQMFLNVDEVFSVMRGEKQTEVMDIHLCSAGAHQSLTDLYSVPGNGKNLSPIILVSKIQNNESGY